MLENMRKTRIAAAVAATLAAGTLAAAVPAAAAGIQGPGIVASAPDSAVQDVAWKYRHHRHWRGGNDWVGPLIGGMVLGGMLTAPYYGGYYAPPPRYYYAPPRYRTYNSHDAYCHARFRSYNSHTGLYFGYDGRYHPC